MRHHHRPQSGRKVRHQTELRGSFGVLFSLNAVNLVFRPADVKAQRQQNWFFLKLSGKFLKMRRLSRP